ncbi:replication initiation protein RepC [Bartonella sp. CB169]|uniref:replication initiation protein RepC n=1 Tax=Bartonella sp. CB169 TaxID=3112257 RepID=UPI00300DED2B
MPQINPNLLSKALPNTAMFIKHGLQSERDLIGSMEHLSKVMHISSHAIEQAKNVMGLKKAALAIGIILEKYWRLIPFL